MNTETGEIKQFQPGEAIPDGWVPLKRLAKADCPLCKGAGKHLVKEPGRRGKIHYQPCDCTQ